MAYEKLSEVLNIINTNSNINESNIIEKIKEKLEKEDSDAYKKWQNNEFDINYTFDDQRTLLYIIARNDLTEVAELLIKKGADVNEVGQDRRASLHVAASNGSIRIVKSLIEKGAIINAIDEEGRIPLHYAAAQNHIEIVNVLIKKNADINQIDHNGWTPLCYAAQDGYIDVVNALIKNKADVNIANKKGLAPLHYAVLYDHIDVVNALIKNGAGITIVDNENGSTPLHYAACFGRIEIVKALIAAGTDVNVVNEIGDTALFCALFSNNYCIKKVKTLLEAKADPLLIKDPKMLKRLVELIKNNFEHPKKTGKTQQQVDDEYESIKYSLLLNNGHSLIDVVEKNTFCKLISAWFADVSSLTESQKKLNRELLSILKDFPPLTKKDRKNNIKKLKNFLLDYKDSKDLKIILNLERGESQLTILHVLSSIECKDVEECIGLLIEAGADLDKKDDKGRTPLHYAARFTCGRLVDFLLERGANPNIQDNEGKTPREVTINNENYRIKESMPLKTEIECKKSEALWDGLISDQLRQMNDFVYELDNAESMDELEKIVNEAIKCGMGFNFSYPGSIYEKKYESRYNFTAVVLKVNRKIDVAVNKYLKFVWAYLFTAMLLLYRSSFRAILLSKQSTVSY